MIKFFFTISVTVILLFVISCSDKTNSRQKEESIANNAEKEGADEQPDQNTATLTDEQIESIGVEMDSIQQKQLTSAIKANGVLKVPNQNKASVNSIYSGVIKSLLVQPGNHVSKGQTIATIANPNFIQAQSEYLNVNSKIVLAELEVKRQKELNAGNAGSLKNLQAAETNLSTLRTARSTYAQQIQLMGINPARLSNGKLISLISLTSPISGVVSDVKVQMGSYVDVSTVVAEIVDNSQLHLDLFVYEKDLPKLKNNQTIHFTVTNNPEKEYDAQVYSLGSSFEGASKAVSVHAKVLGAKTGLIDGMNVTAVISLEQSTVPAVPSEALVTVDGRDYIFVLIDDHPGSKQKDSTQKELSISGKAKGGNDELSTKGKTFERVAVVKGKSDIGYTEITLLKEIPSNAKIVTKGAFFVSAKMTNIE